jgi:hypothetical protein
MQRKEQKVILLEDLPDQDEYQMAQPKVRASSRRSVSRLTKGSFAVLPQPLRVEVRMPRQVVGLALVAWDSASFAVLTGFESR